MAKKIKEPKKKPNDSHNVLGCASSDVFKNLFGGISQENGAVSIFSDNNPFRRKPIDSQQHFDSVPASKGSDFQGNDGVDLKERKRKKEERQSFDSDSENGASLSGTKKSKKKAKVKKLDVGHELDAVLKEGKSSGENKKKRKRDGLENEYKTRRYGVAEDLERESGAVVVGEKRKVLDNQAELVSKEGFDDESKLLRTIFVGNLPIKVKKKALMKEFSQFGEIESVRIRSVPILDSKTPRKGAIMKKQINDAMDNVHAYIVFKAEESAKSSLAHNMNVVEGNHLRVDRACPPRKKLKEDNVSVPLYDNKRTVFVGNLPFDVKDEELYQLFCGIKHLESSVEAVRVVRHSDTSVGKGIAYVLFKTKEAANVLVRTRNLKLRNRELRLSHAKAESTPSKRENPFDGRNDATPKKAHQASSSRTSQDSRVNSNSTISSYQGLRVNKSGVVKKFRAKTSEPMKFKSTPQRGEKIKIRSTKRPAVAARKEGMKRKQENRTPQSSRPNKKAKRFR